MTDSYQSMFLDDPEFQSLLVGCLESLQRGETIDRDALARDFPRYADEIHQFLNDRQLLEQVASDFGDVEPSNVAISAYEKTIATASDANDFTAGDTVRYIGEYEILEEIARGGMGVVFKACQQKLKRIVALKMILAGKLADTSDIERFQREARAAGRLKHRAIVPVHEIGEHDGRHYFTMDFVEGQSLAETMREETLSPKRAAMLVRATAEAVHYAHEQGTIHRDLKPANILIDQNGQPQVTDFGLAKMLESFDEESRAELTASGQILGTPSYMSPEQASGKQELVGPASDIYSLGAILYACLTGRAPFVADSPVDTLLQVMKKEPVSPRELNPSVPKDLETICLKCLTKEPHKRYGTAQELAGDLNRFLEGHPVVARPVGPISRTIRWCRRNKAVAGLLCLLLVSMAIGTSVSASYAIEAVHNAQSEARQRVQAENARKAAEAERLAAEAARREAEQQRDQAEQARAKEQLAHLAAESARMRTKAAMSAEAKARERAEESLKKEAKARQNAEAQRRKAQWQTYVARLHPMRQAWLDGEFGHLDRLCQQSTPADDEPDFRGWEWYFLQAQARSRFEHLGSDDLFSGFFSYCPTTHQVLFERSESNWEFWDVSTNRLLGKYTLPRCRPETVRLSPDGRCVAWGTWDSHVQILNLESDQILHDIEAHTEHNSPKVYIGDVAWSPDGKQLATSAMAPGIKLWDASTGEFIKELNVGFAHDRIGVLAWSSTGGLASLHRYGWIRVWDIKAGKPRWSKNFQNVYLGTLQWNPSGTKLGVGISGSTAVFSAGGELLGKLSNEGDVLTWVDDDELVYGGVGQEIRFVDTASFAESEPLKIHAGRIVKLAKVAERWILSGSLNGPLRRFRREPDDTVVQVTDTNIGPELEISGSDNKLAWSPDGKRIVTLGKHGNATIRDAESLTVDRELALPDNGNGREVAWRHRDNRLFARRGTKLLQWNPDSGELISEIELPASGQTTLDPTSSRIAILAARAGIFMVDTDTGRTLWEAAPPSLPSSFVFGPLGRRIARMSSSSGLRILSAANGHELFVDRLDRRNPTRGTGITWHPNGKLVAAGSGEILAYDAVSPGFLTGLEGHREMIYDLDFSPNGDRLASVGAEPDVLIWDSATGELLMRIPLEEETDLMRAKWSPDGTRLAVLSRQGRLWVLKSSSVHPEAHHPDFLADGILRSVKGVNEQLAELTLDVENQPNIAGVVRKRAEWYVRQARWDEALQDFERTVEIEPGNLWLSASAARTALIAGNRTAFEQHLKRLRKEVQARGKPVPGSTGAMIASTAALDPGLWPPGKEVEEMAKAYSVDNEHALWASTSWILVTLRLGATEELLELLNQYRSENSPNYRIFLDAVEALVYHQMGDSQRAQQALDAAMKQAEQTWIAPAEDEPVTYSDMRIFVEASAMLTEAKAKIRWPGRASAEKNEPGEAPGENTAPDAGKLSSAESRLLDQLSSDDSATRTRALKAIASLGADAAFALPQLLEVLHQQDSYEKTLALRCLTRIGPAAAEAVPQLHSLLKDKDKQFVFRMEAMKALDRIGSAGEVVIPTLLDLLKNPGALEKSYPKATGSPAAAGLMAPMLHKGDDGRWYFDRRDENILLAIGGLGAFGTAAAQGIPELQKVSDDADMLPLVRQAAKQALARNSARPDALDGKWQIQQAFKNGKELTEASRNSGKVEFSNGRYSSSLRANPVPYELDPTKTPAAIDFVINHNGKNFRGLGIYKIEGDTVTLVMHEPPTSYRPQTFQKDIPPEAKAKQTGRLFLVLKRGP